MHRVFALLGVCVAAVALAGCSKTFTRDLKASSDTLVTVSDSTADVSRVYVYPQSKDPIRGDISKSSSIARGPLSPNAVICPEPSPDIARAFQQVGQLSLKDNAEGKLENSNVVIQLTRRIATIQLLRDELADLCRSYANGATTRTTYTLRLSKLDRKMVTLMLAESVGAKNGPPLWDSAMASKIMPPFRNSSVQSRDIAMRLIRWFLRRPTPQPMQKRTQN